jgi:hypothetical protein
LGRNVSVLGTEQWDDDAGQSVALRVARTDMVNGRNCGTGGKRVLFSDHGAAISDGDVAFSQEGRSEYAIVELTDTLQRLRIVDGLQFGVLESAAVEILRARIRRAQDDCVRLRLQKESGGFCRRSAQGSVNKGGGVNQLHTLRLHLGQHFAKYLQRFVVRMADGNGLAFFLRPVNG